MSVSYYILLCYLMENFHIRIYIVQLNSELDLTEMLICSCIVRQYNDLSYVSYCHIYY